MNDVPASVELLLSVPTSQTVHTTALLEDDCHGVEERNLELLGVLVSPGGRMHNLLLDLSSPGNTHLRIGCYGMKY